MSTKKESKLNFNDDNTKNDENNISSYCDENGDYDYDYLNDNKHSSYNDEYYD